MCSVFGQCVGFQGVSYDIVKGILLCYDDCFDDYWVFFELCFVEVWCLFDFCGMFYFYFDYCEVYYVKVVFDVFFGCDCFFNELIWVYDYGVKSIWCWFIKYDMILVYVKDFGVYYFDSEVVDWELYMVFGLVMFEKVVCGKFFIDVWWYIIVIMNGSECIGYFIQKLEGVLCCIVQVFSVFGDFVIDLFVGLGMIGVVVYVFGCWYLLVDESLDVVVVMCICFFQVCFVMFDL